MYTQKHIEYIKALTPVHAGAGQGLEIVDMPIQREKHSNIPKIEASSLKGALKHHLYHKIKSNSQNSEVAKEDLLYTIFGSERGDDNASAIGFTDARLLLFPVKSATDIFKLVTCPYVLKRWLEDDKQVITTQESNVKFELKIEDGNCIPFSNSGSKVILEEYVFSIETNVNKDVEKIRAKFKEMNETMHGIDVEKVVILSDSDFVDMVTMYTEIITRNSINPETGTVNATGLFSEEYLPSESIMYFLVLGSPSFGEKNITTADGVIAYYKKEIGEVFQVGGNSTIGKGFVKILFRGDI
jgi:CRISPR-associated protein Cmr4